MRSASEIGSARAAARWSQRKDNDDDNDAGPVLAMGSLYYSLPASPKFLVRRVGTGQTNTLS